ncbi:hypothetical protein CVT26_012038 [Gymnopilus dilepis]|uniref:Uncharacterized protein n=1 Tax=Gymnopilus dilepis TaxID=231916 RepID=A0A409VYE0_9AGAR|nr:hypothetical protein CVT26_012038 [Gymnopilus dilepis]
MAQAIFDDLYLFALAAEADEHIKNFNLEKYYYNELFFSGQLASFPPPQQQIVSNSPHGYPTAEHCPSPAYPAPFETPFDFQWHSGLDQYECDPTCLISSIIQANSETHSAPGDTYGTAYPSYNLAANHHERVQQALQERPSTPALHYAPETTTYLHAQTCRQPGYNPQPTYPPATLLNNPVDCPKISTNQSAGCRRMPAKNCQTSQALSCLATQTVADSLPQQQRKFNCNNCSVSLPGEAGQTVHKHRSTKVPGAGAVVSSEEHLIERPAHYEALLDGRASSASGVVKRNAHTAVDLLSDKGRPEAKPAMKEFKFIMHDPLAPKRVRNSKRKATEDLEANSPPSPSERPVKRLRVATASPFPGSPSSSVSSSA